MLRMSQTLQVDENILASGDAPSGMGEVRITLAALDFANAIVLLIGK